MKYQAVVHLGGGIKGDGTLPEVVKPSMHLAADILKTGDADKLVVSTKWSGFLDYEPPITEAEAMARYAITLGVNPDSIRKEEDSMETAGNLIFTKQKYLKPHKLKRIAVITRDYHMRPRTVYLSRRCLGSDYEIDFIETPTNIDERIKQNRMKHEQKALRLYKIMFAGLSDGNDKDMRGRLERWHPFYSQKVRQLTDLLGLLKKPPDLYEFD